MDTQTIVDLVINQIGEEKAKEFLGVIKGLFDKAGDGLYVVTKLGDKGLCIICSDKEKGNFNHDSEEAPKIIEIETMINNIEV